MSLSRLPALFSKGLLVALFLYLAVATDLLSPGCTGADPCQVCKNCKYCKHCAKDGGTCGVCKKHPSV